MFRDCGLACGVTVVNAIPRDTYTFPFIRSAANKAEGFWSEILGIIDTDSGERGTVIP